MLSGILVSTGILLTATLILVFGKDFISSSVIAKGALELRPQAERLRADVHALFGTTRPRSARNGESLQEASRYIEREWLKLGLNVEKQHFKAGTHEVHNLIVRLGFRNEDVGNESSQDESSRDHERWVLGAHYDICDEEDSENRGADDNASGVAVLLEVSRLIVENKLRLPHPVELVAYTTEEPPFFETEQMGSYVHASSLKKQGVKVRGMISLEMLGYFSDEEGSQGFPFSGLKTLYPSKGNFLMVAGDMRSISLGRMVRSAFRKTIDIPTHTLNAPDIITGIQYSDHRNYSALGYKAVMLTDTSFYRNPHYHKASDRPETLDYEKMAEIARAVSYFVNKD